MSLSDSSQRVVVRTVETAEGKETVAVSQAALVTFSLLHDIDAARSHIVPGSQESAREIQELAGTLQLAYKQSELCSGEEGKIVLAQVLLRDTRIHLELMGRLAGGTGRKALQTAISRAERAVELDPHPVMLTTLAEAYIAGGQKKKAILVLEAVAQQTDEGTSIPAQKMLLKVRQDVADESNIALQVVNFVSNHTKPMSYLLVSLVFYLISTRVEHIVALWLLLRIGWFLNLILGLITLLKELATKKTS